METVGFFMANPTGGPVPGSQLNSVKPKGSSIKTTNANRGFGQLLNKVTGQEAVNTKGAVKTPVGEKLFEDFKANAGELLTQLRDLLKLLQENDQDGAIVPPVDGSQAAETAQSLLQVGQVVEELLVALEKAGLLTPPEVLAMQSGNVNQTKLLNTGALQLEGSALMEENPAEQVFGKDLVQTLVELKKVVQELQLFYRLKGLQDGYVDEKTMAQLQKSCERMVIGFKQAIAQLQQVALHSQAQQSETVGPSSKSNPTNELNQSKTPLMVGNRVTEAGSKLEKAMAKVSGAVERLVKAIGEMGERVVQDTSVSGSDEAKGALNIPVKAIQIQPQEVSVQTLNTTTNPKPLATFQSILSMIATKTSLIKGAEHSEFTIQLKPEFLGKLQMKIVVENGLVTAKFAAETQQVKELLETNLSSLRQNLGDQGIKVEHLEVTLSSGKDLSREFNSFDRGSSQWQHQSTKRFATTPGNDEQDEVSRFPGYFMEDSTIDYTI